MNIYKVIRPYANYGEAAGHVVVANNENEVLDLVKPESGLEGPADWETAEIELISMYTGKMNEPFILLTDFFNE